MNQDQVLDEFRAAGALLEGHFILSSGLHSPVFFQKNALVQSSSAKFMRQKRTSSTR